MRPMPPDEALERERAGEDRREEFLRLARAEPSGV